MNPALQLTAIEISARAMRERLARGEDCRAHASALAVLVARVARHLAEVTPGEPAEQTERQLAEAEGHLGAARAALPK